MITGILLIAGLLFVYGLFLLIQYALAEEIKDIKRINKIEFNNNWKTHWKAIHTQKGTQGYVNNFNNNCKET